jgi:arsenate reductase
MLNIYGIKSCDTMKKAFTWLTEHGIEHHFHDYKKEGADETRLRHWIDQLGWETVINRRGTTWRKLPQAQRDAMDVEGAVQAALANPSLIKRPIIEQGTILLAGFDAAAWAQALNT